MGARVEPARRVVPAAYHGLRRERLRDGHALLLAARLFFDARLRGAVLKRDAGVAMGLYLCERGTDAGKEGEWVPLSRLRRPDGMLSEDISPALEGYSVGEEMPA